MGLEQIAWAGMAVAGMVIVAEGPDVALRKTCLGNCVPDAGKEG
jgi:hypothetical protein